MRIRISGKQVELGQTLPIGVKARLEQAIAKHFDGNAQAHIVFSHDGPFFRADCTVHLDSKTVLSAEGDGPDAHRAFDVAFAHIEKQLRRHKRKLKNHHPKVRVRPGAPA